MNVRHDMIQIAFKAIQSQGMEPSTDLKVSVSDSGVTVVFEVLPEDLRPIPDGLCNQQKKIYLVFEPKKSLSTEQVARLSGYKSNSHLRQALADMVQAGILKNGENGYCMSGSVDMQC